MLLCYIATHVHMGAYGMPMPQPNHAVPTLPIDSTSIGITLGDLESPTGNGAIKIVVDWAHRGIYDGRSHN